jgi:hypothetical protein
MCKTLCLAPVLRRTLRGRSRGQSLAETAITLPVILLLALGVTDLGRSFYYREAVTNSVRQALRMAVSPYQQNAANSACANTAGGPVATTLSSTVNSPFGIIATIANQAALESSSDGTPSGSAMAGAVMYVTFHCLNGAGITNATGNGNAPSDPGSDSITVTITKPMPLVTPLMWPIFGTSVPITVMSSQRVEY